VNNTKADRAGEAGLLFMFFQNNRD